MTDELTHPELNRLNLIRLNLNDKRLWDQPYYHPINNLCTIIAALALELADVHSQLDVLVRENHER